MYEIQIYWKSSKKGKKLKHWVVLCYLKIYVTELSLMGRHLDTQIFTNQLTLIHVVPH